MKQGTYLANFRYARQWLISITTRSSLLIVHIINHDSNGGRWQEIAKLPSYCKLHYMLSIHTLHKPSCCSFVLPHKQLDPMLCCFHTCPAKQKE